MQIRRFWLRTIGISVAFAILLAMAVALVSATAVWAVGQKYSDPAEGSQARTFSGVLTDVHCGARHSSKSHLSAGDCARMCLTQGTAWGLVDGERLYTLKGDSPILDKLAGERITVIGTLEGSTIQVHSVEPQNR